MPKLYSNKKGFTLTEVMIGITILTLAIVSATNLLVGLLNSNENNLKSLQAYYLAVEGVEAVRNIRDTNWLHNRNWLGAGSDLLWGEKFSVPLNVDEENAYTVGYRFSSVQQGPDDASVGTILALENAKPWQISTNIDQPINKVISGDNVYYSSEEAGEDSGFKREIIIKKYQCVDLGCDDEKTVLVESLVSWEIGRQERTLKLSTVLTDWKGGVF